VVKTSDGSSFTGLTSAVITGKRYLYAANFTKAESMSMTTHSIVWSGRRKSRGKAFR
jgi:hypothetical protein